MGRLAAISTSGGGARVAVAIPVRLEPIQRFVGVDVGRREAILHGECVMNDGDVALVVDLDLDTAVGGSPVVTKLIIFTVNLAEEAESFVLDGIDALDSDEKTEKEKEG